MKTLTALLALTLTATLTLSAAADDTLAGSWQVEEISSTKPPKGAALTFAFADEAQATVTYTLAGESQSWTYQYTIENNQLKLQAVSPLGEPNIITYDIKFDEGKLLLLTPKPAEEKADDAADDKPDAEPKAEEEDTRVPVWVLVKG